MSWEQFFLMRQELSLIGLVLLVLIIEISLTENNKHKIIPIVNIALALVVAWGFFNQSYGEV